MTRRDIKILIFYHLNDHKTLKTVAQSSKRVQLCSTVFPPKMLVTERIAKFLKIVTFASSSSRSQRENNLAFYLRSKRRHWCFCQFLFPVDRSVTWTQPVGVEWRLSSSSNISRNIVTAFSGNLRVQSQTCLLPLRGHMTTLTNVPAFPALVTCAVVRSKCCERVVKDPVSFLSQFLTKKGKLF